MDVRDYEYIVAIAEYGSISKAAARLFITQSALSRFLQRTEEKLGQDLFIREGKQFLLTRAGQQYVETGKVILNLDRQLEAELEKQKEDLQKHITIGIGMGATDDFLSGIFPKLREKYPGISVSLKADSSRRNAMALQNGQLDMAILLNQPRMPGFTYEKIRSSWLCILVRKDSLWVKEARIAPGYPFPVIKKEKVNAMHFITLNRMTNSGLVAQETLEQNHLTPEKIVEVYDVRSLVNAVSYGLGEAMLMSFPLNGDQLMFLSVEGIGPIEQQTEIAYRSDLALSPPMKEIIRLLEKRG